MATSDYIQALEAVTIVPKRLKGTPIEAVWGKDLAIAMRTSVVAINEESVANSLVSCLAVRGCL